MPDGARPRPRGDSGQAVPWPCRLTGRLTVAQVKRAHKLLAVQHHPDKGGDPEVMTRFNTARDVLLEPEMEMLAA